MCPCCQYNCPFLQNCSLVIRDQPYDHTGSGFVRATEGTKIEFTIDDVPKTGQYDIIVRYVPQIKGDWEDVRITVIRPDIFDPSGEHPCNIDPAREAEVPTTLSEYDRSVVALYDVCLESGKVYKLIISFDRKNRYEENPTAQILIDSIALVPRIEVTSIFQGGPPGENRMREFVHFNCNTTYYDVNYDQKLNEKCRELLNAVSIVQFNGATRKLHMRRKY